MEEIQMSQMAQVRLETNFDAEQWEAIRKRTPKEFQASQRRALEAMLKDPRLNECYFARFSENHATLVSWYTQATRLKPQIEKYTFKLLVGREGGKVEFDNEKLKRAVQDPHALYLSTFHACNGWKYIYYNYERHMKGASERTLHNNNIRTQESKQLSCNPVNHPLRAFEESDLPVQRTALLLYKEVLPNARINSRAGFENILKRNELQKLVFINHQGKPIRYLLKPHLAA